MKSIGIVRSVDREGRIVIPIELRKIFNLQTGTPIEIYTEGDFIILHKYHNLPNSFCSGTSTEKSKRLFEMFSEAANNMLIGFSNFLR